MRPFSCRALASIGLLFVMIQISNAAHMCNYRFEDGYDGWGRVRTESQRSIAPSCAWGPLGFNEGTSWDDGAYPGVKFSSTSSGAKTQLGMQTAGMAGAFATFRSFSLLAWLTPSAIASPSLLLQIGNCTSSSDLSACNFGLYFDGPIFTLRLQHRTNGTTRVAAVSFDSGECLAPGVLTALAVIIRSGSTSTSFTAYCNGTLLGESVVFERLTELPPGDAALEVAPPANDTHFHAWQGALHGLHLQSPAIDSLDSLLNETRPSARIPTVQDVVISVPEHRSAITSLQLAGAVASHGGTTTVEFTSFNIHESCFAATLASRTINRTTESFAGFSTDVINITALGNYSLCAGASSPQFSFRAKGMAGSHWTLYAFIYFKVLDQSPPVANETVVDIVTPGCEVPLAPFTGRNQDSGITMASAQIIKVDDSDSSLLIKRYLSTNWSNTEVLLSNATSLPAYSDTYGGSREPALTVMYNRSKPFLSHLSSEIIDHITVWFVVKNALGISSAAGVRSVQVRNWLIPRFETVSTPPYETTHFSLENDFAITLLSIPSRGTLYLANSSIIEATDLPLYIGRNALQYRPPDGLVSNQSHPIVAALTYRYTDEHFNLSSYAPSTLGFIVRPTVVEPTFGPTKPITAIKASGSIDSLEYLAIADLSDAFSARTLDIQNWYNTTFTIQVHCACRSIIFNFTKHLIGDVVIKRSTLGLIEYTVSRPLALDTAFHGLAAVLIDPLSRATITATITESSSIGTATIASQTSLTFPGNNTGVGDAVVQIAVYVLVLAAVALSLLALICGAICMRKRISALCCKSSSVNPPSGIREGAKCVPAEAEEGVPDMRQQLLAIAELLGVSKSIGDQTWKVDPGKAVLELLRTKEDKGHYSLHASQPGMADDDAASTSSWNSSNLSSRELLSTQRRVESEMASFSSLTPPRRPRRSPHAALTPPHVPLRPDQPRQPQQDRRSLEHVEELPQSQEHRLAQDTSEIPTIGYRDIKAVNLSHINERYGQRQAPALKGIPEEQIDQPLPMVRIRRLDKTLTEHRPGRSLSTACEATQERSLGKDDDKGVEGSLHDSSKLHVATTSMCIPTTPPPPPRKMCSLATNTT